MNNDKVWVSEVCVLLLLVRVCARAIVCVLNVLCVRTGECERIVWVSARTRCERMSAMARREGIGCVCVCVCVRGESLLHYPLFEKILTAKFGKFRNDFRFRQN